MINFTATGNLRLIVEGPFQAAPEAALPAVIPEGARLYALYLRCTHCTFQTAGLSVLVPTEDKTQEEIDQAVQMEVAQWVKMSQEKGHANPQFNCPHARTPYNFPAAVEIDLPIDPPWTQPNEEVAPRARIILPGMAGWGKN